MNKNKIYLSDVRDALPMNCIYNKVRVGCGGTTLALNSKDPYVICVPYVSLIDNKIAQNKDKFWFAVKSSVRPVDVQRYIAKCDEMNVVPKILITYDSLAKLNEAINTDEFYLLIDEYHVLFQQYSFRYNAVRCVLDNYKWYKGFTFMTATPLTTDEMHNFMPVELKDIPIVTQDWSIDDSNDTVTVEAVQCNSVKAKVVDIIQHHLLGHIKGNAYFFVNSCSFIDDIFTKTEGLCSKNTRVIYSTNNHKHYTFDRGFTTDKCKKINFVTSTCFEGSDIYDEDGMTYIVSDSKIDHTLLDISSSCQQIAGRIRDSKYKSKIIHIYSKDRYLSATAADFEKKTHELALFCQEKCRSLNEKLTAEEKSTISIKSDIAPYLMIRDACIIYDDNLRLLDLYNYTIRCQYKCKASIELAYQQAGNIAKVDEWMKSLKDVDFWNNVVVTFKDAVLECREASKTSKLLEIATIQKYEGRYPILSDAIRILGYKKICSLRYVQRDIKDQLLLHDKRGNIAQKVIAKVGFRSGQWLSNDDVKTRLQHAYDVLKVKKNADAVNVKDYYFCKYHSKMVNGEKTMGYTIYSPLYKTKNQ